MDVQDNDLRKVKEMVYKSERDTDSGTETTFFVRGDVGETAKFLIESYKMSDCFAAKANDNRVERSVEVKIFDGDSLEWKVLIPSRVFSYGDCIDMQMDGCRDMLYKIQKYVRDFFGIKLTW